MTEDLVKGMINPNGVSNNGDITKDTYDDIELGGDLAHYVTGVQSLLNKLPPPREDYAPKVKQYLNDYGNYQILSIEIRRAPIHSMLRKVIDTISLNALPPDTLYHLWVVLDIATPNGVIPFKLEKNHIIEFAPNKQNDGEKLPLVMHQKLTTDELLAKTKERMGSKFFPYDAFHNNCQDFILNMLEANGLLISNPTAKTFIKQDLSKKMSDPRLKWTSGISNYVTNLAARFDRLFKGGDLTESGDELYTSDEGESSSDDDENDYTSSKNEVTPKGAAVYVQKIPDPEGMLV